MKNRGRVVEVNFKENTVKIKVGRKATLKLQEQCYTGEKVCIVD